MPTDQTTRAVRRYRVGGFSEAEETELIAHISARLAPSPETSGAEPGWLAEAFEAAWLWLVAGPEVG